MEKIHLEEVLMKTRLRFRGTSQHHVKQKSEDLSLKKSSGVIKVRFGILPRLIMGFVIPVAFIIVLGVISYKKASEGLLSNYEQATDNTISMATGYLEYVASSVDALSVKYSEDKTLSYFTRGLVYTDKQERLSYVMTMNNEFLKTANLEKFIENLHIIANENIPVLTSDMENLYGFYDEFLLSDEGSNLKVEDKENYWIGSHPLLDEKVDLDGEDYAISFVRKFPDSDACIVIDIGANEIAEFLMELDLGENSIVALTTAEGKEIIIKNGVAEGEPTDTDFSFLNQDYYNKIKQDTNLKKSEYVEYKSEQHLFMYSKLGDTGLTICALIPKSSFMQQAGEIRTTTIIVVLLASILAVTIGILISKGIGQSLKNINKKLLQVSEGDLTVHVSVKRNDEFAILASNIMDMLNNMRALIQKMAHVSGLVSESASNVMEASKSIALSNSNITKAVDEIGKGIEGQAEDSQNSLTQMDELSKKISMVYSNLTEIEGLTEDMKQMVSNGIQTMGLLTKQSEATNDITRYVMNNIEALEEKTKSIADIIQVINDIADQTNLLSLNASIEAARAGDVGKGFAVVAIEIRKLAYKSMTASNEIKEVIDKIMQQTADTVISAKEAQNVVNMQNDAVSQSIDAFGNMNAGIERLIANLSVIGNNMKNMEIAREGSLMAVENISAIAEQTLANSNTIEETVYEQAKSVVTLDNASKEMSENAKELNEAIHIFRI
jgi:methyl-accepting chemotaxis protein